MQRIPFAFRIGLAFTGVDAVLSFLLIAIGRGGLNFGLLLDQPQSALTVTWNFIHAPVDWLIVPTLILYSPTHGAALQANLLFAAYLFICLAYAFSIGFALGAAASSIRHAMDR